MGNLDFKGWLIANGHKQYELAELLGLTKTTLNKKLNGHSEFTISQVKTICEHYHISANIFL